MPTARCFTWQRHCRFWRIGLVVPGWDRLLGSTAQFCRFLGPEGPAVAGVGLAGAYCTRPALVNREMTKEKHEEGKCETGGMGKRKAGQMGGM